MKNRMGQYILVDYFPHFIHVAKVLEFAKEHQEGRVHRKCDICYFHVH